MEDDGIALCNKATSTHIRTGIALRGILSFVLGVVDLPKHVHGNTTVHDVDVDPHTSTSCAANL